MTAKVTFAVEYCKGCELCAMACPKKIIALDPHHTNSRGYHPAAVTDMSLCIGCASCARMCPDSVITVERF
ncbi:MAG TPA: 4Fe-4S binding protein [Eubacteriales bacterium]|nr:4Fe-4S binding protein [Clostridia bacterium]HRV73384.1 4Fe-4S binding protein [Eubacteriales bacterium]